MENTINMILNNGDGDINKKIREYRSGELV